MSYSFYEVYITAQRAFTAMGFPYGSDEDAAFIIAWLELNKFQGVFLLSNLIQELDNKYDGRIDIKNFNKKIDFHNKSILMKGAGLIDFMNSQIKNKNKISVKIINCIIAENKAKSEYQWGSANGGGVYLEEVVI